jgi:hypothetical protein
MTEWKSNVQEYKHVDLAKKKTSCHKYRSHSTEGVQDGVKVAPARVVRAGETVVPTHSIKIITSIMVKFPLATDL